jgi:uncharacterized protein with gpF-like domain
VLGDNQAEWHRVYERIYTVTGRHFFREVYRAILPPKSIPLDIARKQEDAEYDLWMERTTGYLHGADSASKIVGINEATREQVRKELSAGVVNGEGIEALAARIDKLYLDHIIPNRSETIARTEVINASNMGSYQGAAATGVATEKQWISTHDDRARPDHWNVADGGADGQVSKMEDPFVVGGHKLMWPGDSSQGAPADQIINCRCTLGYPVTW